MRAMTSARYTEQARRLEFPALHKALLSRVWVPSTRSRGSFPVWVSLRYHWMPAALVFDTSATTRPWSCTPSAVDSTG